MLIPPREKWYRMEDREHTRTLATHKADQWITTQRIIVRAGYEWQPFDMPHDEEDTLFVRELAYVSGCTEEQVKRIMCRMMTGASYYSDIPLPELGDFDRHLGYALRKQLRHDWMADKYAAGRRIRTFWYADMEDTRQIERVVTKQCGDYYSGSYDWEDGYEPAGLAAWVYQPLYKIASPLYDDRDKPIPLYVHPLDVIEPIKELR